MVVHDLHTVGVSVPPTEADSPLLIDPDTVLPRPITLELLESIPWGYAQVLQAKRRVQLNQFAQGHALQV